MKKQQRTKLAGSYTPLSGHAGLPETNKDETIEVTIRLRRKKDLPEDSFTGNFLSREIYEKDYSAAKEDADKVEAFVHEHLLSTVKVSLSRRSVIVKGTISNLEKAFGTNLKNYNNCRALTSEIEIPEELKDIIVGVFGMDNQPIARPMFQVAKKNGKFISHAAAPHAFTPDQLSRIYNFPTGVTGNGQCIGIIELGGGFRIADIQNYFKSLNIAAPIVKAIAVDGGTNNPTTANSADGEVMLDIEVAGAIARGANIVVYFAPNTDQGFLDAITQAIHDIQNKPSVISISWGSAELNWTQQALTNFNETFKTAAALGVTVCAASGDSGSRDGETDGKVHVDFPASSPYVLACGGTKLVVNGNKISFETVWHESADSASGGGVSSFFALPNYQANAGVPLEIDTKFRGRGVPDVAADADPNTGYKVLVDGQQLVIGGTSAVAPLMAGLIALLNEKNKKSSGFIQPHIYAVPGICRDIIKGDNITTSQNTGYTAVKGWDACTGLGVLSKI